MKGVLLSENCSSVVLLLENGVRLEADAVIHDVQKMLDLWHLRYEVVEQF